MSRISKQLTCQKFIYKLHSSRLRKSGWKLTLPIREARNNDEVISLADSQVLRWIDELNGITDADERAKAIKREIRAVKKEPSSFKNKKRILQLYNDLDDLQFKKDYMCLIIDKNSDYHRARKGFYINDVKYVRLLGTNGGIKNSTIVFVSERLYPELNKRINNGRDMSVPLVTAKLEAYKALACSASTPVSYPKGLLVVNDVETVFKDEIMQISDEDDGEPKIAKPSLQEIKLDACDGCGMIHPSLARQWAVDLKLDYLPSGFNSRNSWEKGMVYTFDFLDFAENVAHRHIVKDAWGNEVDIRTVDLVLTTSMLKLWDSYSSCEDYLRNCMLNKYTFGVTKVCPETLDNERSLNYQFIQSFDLTDTEIEELIRPTMQNFKDVLSDETYGDWRKTVLFLKGESLSLKTAENTFDDIGKAVMIDRRMLDDPYVHNSIYQTIKNKINEAKVGVIKIHGNYSTASGDPYLLCQSMFGLELTGLLKSGEIYNRYWSDRKAKKLLCFRAPMTTHENIRAVTPADNEQTRRWYRYMPCCTVFNGWDTCMIALNGMD